MNQTDTESSNPYQAFAGTPEWSVIDRAIQELARNHDLEEKTAHRYIVGYLCQALAAKITHSPHQSNPAIEEIQAIVTALQREFQAKNPGRDPLEEFLAERRMEAERE